MISAKKLAKKYLEGEPVDLADMIPELLDQIDYLSTYLGTQMDRKRWTSYTKTIRKAIDHKIKVENRK